MTQDEEGNINIGAIANHFKRKYEREAAESLALAVALEEAQQKNAMLHQINDSLRSQLNGEAQASKVAVKEKK